MFSKLIFSCFFICALTVFADEIAVVNEIITDLKTLNKPLKGQKLDSQAKKHNETIKNKIISKLDFDYMGKKILEANYPKLTAQEKQSFNTLFQKLLLKNLSKSSGASKNTTANDYSLKINPKIQKKNELNIVKSTLSKKGEEDIEIAYVFLKDKIVDLIIDEESISQNFKEQFSEIIRDEGIQGLLKLMTKNSNNNN